MKPCYTSCTVAGREVDNVAVFYDTWPAEPDVGASAGLEVTSVIEGDNCLLGLMSEDEIAELEERLFVELSEYDDCRGDYLYEQARDARAEGVI